MTGPEVVSLREHVEALFRERERAIELSLETQAKLRVADNVRIQQAQDSAQQAIEKAEDAIERRLNLLNEFRAQSADEAQKYALRELTDAQFDDLKSRIDRIEGGQEGSNRAIGYTIGAAGVLVAVVAVLAHSV